MARLIDADALCAEDFENCTPYQAQGIIDDALTVYAVEVRHGEWEQYWDDNYLSFCHKCSECGSFPLTKEETMHDEVLSAYCPYCGAKMDGERKVSE